MLYSTWNGEIEAASKMPNLFSAKKWITSKWQINLPNTKLIHTSLEQHNWCSLQTLHFSRLPCYLIISHLFTIPVYSFWCFFIPHTLHNAILIQYATMKFLFFRTFFDGSSSDLGTQASRKWQVVNLANIWNAWPV